VAGKRVDGGRRGRMPDLIAFYSAGEVCFLPEDLLRGDEDVFEGV